MNQATVVEYLRDMMDEIAYLAIEPDEPLVVDSLVAAQAKWRVELDLGVDVPLEDYLKGLTLRELADTIVTGALSSAQTLEVDPR